MKLIVKGKENLVRDSFSKGIINTDSEARNRYLRNKEAMLKSRQDIASLYTRVENLETKIDSLLHKLNLFIDKY